MSRDINKVMFSGRLGRDVELRITPNGSSVATFSVASSRSTKQADGQFKEQTEWFRVVAWEKLAETCSSFLKKGSHVFIEGRLQTREWQDPQGQKHQTTEVIASEMVMLSSRRDGEGAESATNGNGRAAETLFDEELEPEGIPF
ncbi:MAG: ssb [Chloroflexi bacterium]|nr:ssb [Chloroflexota bacterium]